MSGLGLRVNLNLIDEVRARDLLKNLTYKWFVAKSYKAKVQHFGIKMGDLVLHMAEVSDPTLTMEKLALSWEGLYYIS